MNSWSITDYTLTPHCINTHCSQKNIQAKGMLPTSKFSFVQKEISISYRKQVSYQKCSLKSSGMGIKYFPQSPLISSCLNSCSLTWTSHFLWIQNWPTYLIAYLQTFFLRWEDVFSKSKLYLLAVLQWTVSCTSLTHYFCHRLSYLFLHFTRFFWERVLQLSLLPSI